MKSLTECANKQANMSGEISDCSLAETAMATSAQTSGGTTWPARNRCTIDHQPVMLLLRLHALGPFKWATFSHDVFIIHMAALYFVLISIANYKCTSAVYRAAPRVFALLAKCASTHNCE